MPLNKTKGKTGVAAKSTIPEKTSTTNSAVTQMLQGNGLVIEDSKFKDTTGLTPETRAIVVSNVLANKKAMFRICLVKLNDIICNVETSDNFGL
jgi:hypothetical protein